MNWCVSDWIRICVLKRLYICMISYIHPFVPTTAMIKAFPTHELLLLLPQRYLMGLSRNPWTAVSLHSLRKSQSDCLPKSVNSWTWDTNRRRYLDTVEWRSDVLILDRSKRDCVLNSRLLSLVSGRIWCFLRLWSVMGSPEIQFCEWMSHLFDLYEGWRGRPLVLVGSVTTVIPEDFPNSSILDL